MPPLHPRCRSSISASLGAAEVKRGTRVARNETSGKTYHVPASMKYADWKKVYVDKSMSIETWENHQSEQLKSEDQRDTIDASGSHDFKVKGFFSKQKLNNHWSKHRKEYPRMTKDEYLQTAITLLESPVGGYIAGHMTADGTVVRYDKKANDFVKGKPDKGIYTMMKPTAEGYYEAQREEDLAHGGKE
jgi:hypothetical protein